ncbi:Lipid A export ATP-binding/permease protein MsbA [Leucoagaricus sp. SymC.cos]|nr:Lipid A export ATP-binding/permease protein MsbA [Leucoagaricus sp. SymC.cos]
MRAGPPTDVTATLCSTLTMPAITPPVKYLKWGTYEVAYDTRRGSLSSRVASRALQTSSELFFYVWRFSKDVGRIAPTTLVVYMTSSVWLGASSALSLYMTFSVLQAIENLTNNEGVDAQGRKQVVYTIFMWLLSVFASVLVHRLKDEEEQMLCGHLRAQFLPSIVRKSLESDVTFIRDHNVRRTFPSPSSFAEGGPGWSLLKNLGERSQRLTSLVSEITVFSLVLYQQTFRDRVILATLSGLFFIVLVSTPKNGVNGAGYTFWSTNGAFNRLHMLYSLVFGDRYRETLAKDGVNEYLAQEYEKCSNDLGIVKCDVISLACFLPPPWYWTVLRSLFLEYSMALCALLLVWNSSLYIITTSIFFQSATNSFAHTIECLRREFNQRAMSQLLAQSQTLYRHLDETGNYQRELTFYSPPTQGGMEIELKNVTFKYQDALSDASTLKRVSLVIPANSFVLLVGANGSGKTTLLKLIARLLEPHSGEILTDGIPLSDYDALSIRRHTTFLMQTEEIYPLSLRENLLMVAPDHPKFEEKARQKMNEAIHLGGADQLIERVGYEVILNPPSIMGQSLQGCGNGVIGEGAIRELEKRTRSKEVSISSGERQRFLAARSFMRLLNSDTRLLMVDEPTSALDPMAERNVFEQFYRKRNGKTTIFVTHRFGSLVKEADIIICMKNGEVVETGHHNKLMKLDGEYAKLYLAQQLMPSSRMT